MSIFYTSPRVGENGKIFGMYKLRTMVEGADKIGGPSTPGDDPRITKWGRFLRKFKLDELPQLWNVIKRDMNLVGPRPEVPQYVGLMSQEEKDIILSIRPGLTDLASLWDFDEGELLKGSPDPEKEYLEVIWPLKKKLQIEYVKNRSLKLDLKIILWTLWKLLRRK